MDRISIEALLHQHRAELCRRAEHQRLARTARAVRRADRAPRRALWSSSGRPLP